MCPLTSLLALLLEPEAGYFCQAGRTVSFQDLPSLELSRLGVIGIQSHARRFMSVLWFELCLHSHSKLSSPLNHCPSPMVPFS